MKNKGVVSQQSGNLSFFFTVMLISACLGCGVTGLRIVNQPTDQTVLAGQTATFSISVIGNSGALSYQWQKDGTPISGATAQSYTTPSTTLADNGLQFQVVVSNSEGRATSDPAMLTVNAATDVLTAHNDNARTGLNATETILTIANVNSATFGKIGFYPVDGHVDAQPLYASNIMIPNNGLHNLLVATTEHGSAYAFDADSGAPIWQVSLLEPGETSSDDPACGSCPEISANATPVIDRAGGPNGIVYIVVSSKDASGGYHQRIHALDLALGSELLGGPVEIQATYPGTGDNTDGTNVIFDPKQYRERAALLLLNGNVYTSWASHYDLRPYTGWILGYSASTLAQSGVLNLTPNGNEGAIWMSGAGLAADAAGNIYFADANGVFDETLDAEGFPSNGDYGNAFLKLSTAGKQLTVADYFEMDNEVEENVGDVDLGSGGVMLLPDLTDSSGHTQHLAVGAGKDSNFYVVNRDSMGKFSENNNNVYQQLTGALPGGVWAAPAFFNNTIYYGPVDSPILAFAVANAKLSSNPFAQSSIGFPYPGTTPSISANGTNNGIVWAVENNLDRAVLHAYNAANLNELYNSDQAGGGRDNFGPGNKFMTPTIANGKVYVGTPNGVAAFGLLSH